MSLRSIPALALVFLLSVALGGCDKKSNAPAPGGTAPAEKTGDKIKAPASVPPAITAQLNKIWPKVEAAGKGLDALHKQATAAAGDRDKVRSLIDEAQKHATTIQEHWGDLYYTHFLDRVDSKEIDEATKRKVERFLAPYERKIKGWNKIAKVLKENSSVR